MKWLCSIFLLCFFSCGGNFTIDQQSKEELDIFPDYKEITIPYNIAPLNFKLADPNRELAFVCVELEDEKWNIPAKSGQIWIPEKKWHALLDNAKGKEIKVTIVCQESGKTVAYAPFHWEVSKEPIDCYLVYRLIEPGYEIWNQMGIYQRDLESFEQIPIIENKQTKNNCMNCHSFCNRDAKQMLFHMRASLGGTVMVRDGELEVLDTKTDQTISGLVYPYWHPSGKYVAFSTNKTTQMVHPSNRVEVFDTASDIVIYQVDNHQITTSSKVASPDAFETFPSFSPDGKTLYYCSAPALSMPDSISRLRYSLCAVPFDAKTGKIGNQVDTLFQSEDYQQSFLFPRISPDGRYLLGTTTAYGTFPIWHKDANLCLIDLQQGRVMQSLKVNSEDTDSYHSWSSNSRWIAFSSRRLDGLYTRIYIGYMSESGELEKAFLLPQQDVDYYKRFMKSYNIPEFTTHKVNVNVAEIREMALKQRVKVTLKK